MTYEIVDSRNGEVIEIANNYDEAADICDAWNILDPDEQPYQVRGVREDGDRPVPTATA